MTEAAGSIWNVIFPVMSSTEAHQSNPTVFCGMCPPRRQSIFSPDKQRSQTSPIDKVRCAGDCKNEELRSFACGRFHCLDRCLLSLFSLFMNIL
jgi:hypothetical protein